MPSLLPESLFLNSLQMAQQNTANLEQREQQLRANRLEEEKNLRDRYVEDLRMAEEKKEREFQRNLKVAELQGKYQQAGIREAPQYKNKDLQTAVNLGGDSEELDAQKAQSQREWDMTLQDDKQQAELMKQREIKTWDFNKNERTQEARIKAALIRARSAWQIAVRGGQDDVAKSMMEIAGRLAQEYQRQTGQAWTWAQAEKSGDAYAIAKNAVFGDDPELFNLIQGTIESQVKREGATPPVIPGSSSSGSRGLPPELQKLAPDAANFTPRTETPPSDNASKWLP